MCGSGNPVYSHIKSLLQALPHQLVVDSLNFPVPRLLQHPQVVLDFFPPPREITLVQRVVDLISHRPDTHLTIVEPNVVRRIDVLLLKAALLDKLLLFSTPTNSTTPAAAALSPNPTAGRST